jgi:hypothetical protein
MPTRDIRLELDPKVSIAPQSIGGAVSGTTIDLQGCEAALVILNNGAATTPATVKVQEAPDVAGSPGAFTDVADTDLIGATGNPAGVVQTASTIVKVSYVGVQRFIRISTTAGTAALFSAEVVRGRLRHSIPSAVV